MPDHRYKKPCPLSYIMHRNNTWYCPPLILTSASSDLAESLILIDLPHIVDGIRDVIVGLGQVLSGLGQVLSKLRHVLIGLGHGLSNPCQVLIGFGQVLSKLRQIFIGPLNAFLESRETLLDNLQLSILRVFASVVHLGHDLTRFRRVEGDGVDVCEEIGKVGLRHVNGLVSGIKIESYLTLVSTAVGSEVS